MRHLNRFTSALLILVFASPSLAQFVPDTNQKLCDKARSVTFKEPNKRILFTYPQSLTPRQEKNLRKSPDDSYTTILELEDKADRARCPGRFPISVSTAKANFDTGAENAGFKFSSSVYDEPGEGTPKWIYSGIMEYVANEIKLGECKGLIGEDWGRLTCGEEEGSLEKLIVIYLGCPNNIAILIKLFPAFDDSLVSCSVNQIVNSLKVFPHEKITTLRK